MVRGGRGGGGLHGGSVMWTEEADAFFGDFCEFEETDHLEAFDGRGEEMVSSRSAWGKIKGSM